MRDNVAPKSRNKDLNLIIKVQSNIKVAFHYFSFFSMEFVFLTVSE